MAMQNLNNTRALPGNFLLRVFLSFQNFLFYRSRDFKQNKSNIHIYRKINAWPKNSRDTYTFYTNKLLPFGKGAIALLWHYHRSCFLSQCIECILCNESCRRLKCIAATLCALLFCKQTLSCRFGCRQVCVLYVDYYY